MRVGFAFAVALTVIGCGGGGGQGGDGGAGADGGMMAIATPDDFANALAVAFCQWNAKCGAIGASEEAKCESDAVAQNKATPPGYSLADALAKGRVAFDAAQAQKCVDAARASGCTLDEQIAAQMPCDTVFAPRVAAGGMCLSSLECVGGYCDTKTGNDGCPGACKAFAAVGSACDPSAANSGCDEHAAVCDGATKKCTARVAEGATCGASARCQVGLFCLASSGDGGMANVCKKPGMAGDACATDAFGGDTCQPGLYCDGTNACAARKSAGAACDSFNACVDGLDCIGLANGGMGKCGAWLDVGKACDSTQAETGCPLDQNCDAMANTCAAVGVLGGACSGGDCRDGLYCDGGTMKCTATVAVGAACTPPMMGADDPCHEGACDAMTKVCALVCM